MRRQIAIVVLVCLAGCGGKKAKWAGAGSGDLQAFGKPAILATGEDTYRSQVLNRDGTYLYYSVVRDPKEGWGFSHGDELYSYNLGLRIKLPLGKLGRSDLYRPVVLDGKEMIAIVKTVDTNDDGDVDEEDANALYLMAPDGLDEEPVSPVYKHVVGVWGDPRGKIVVFATADSWEGMRVPPPVPGEKEKPLDWSGFAYMWSFETKETRDIGRCLRFYGISPDGGEFACMPPAEPGKYIEVVVISRDLATKKKVTLPTGQDEQVVPLGGGRLAYTMLEASSTGDRRTLWLRTAEGKDVRVTSTSVDTKIIKVLADGGVLFASRSRYSVKDATVVRALTGDGLKVVDLLRLEGDVEMLLPAIAGDGQSFTYATGSASLYEAVPTATINIAKASAKARTRSTEEIASEKIPGLGETIVEALRKAIPDGSAVREDAITVSVPMRRAVLPMTTTGDKTDDALMAAALSVRDAVSGVLAKDGYSAVLPLEGLEDAVAVMRWHEEFGKHLTYLVAYGYWLPVRDEYDLVVEDLRFKKMPGCADPRLVQLHCTGWITAVRSVGDGNLELVCQASPLDPGMKLRDGKGPVAGVTPDAGAQIFDIVADKVDPRRSHRSAFDLLAFSGGHRVPFYDASWAEATRAWIAVIRALPGTVLPTKKLLPFTWGEETIPALTRWFPSTVVRQEEHLDVHLFLEEEAGPPIEDKPGWDTLATATMDSFTPFLTEHDPDSLDKIRVSLYKGQLLMTEMWHKTAEEIAIEGCDMGEADPCYQLGLIMKEKGKKLAAEMAFYDACDLGSVEACEELQGAGAPAEGAGEKPAPEEKPKPGEIEKKKELLPPEMVKPAAPPAGLKKSEIQEAIRANMKEIRYCFEKEGLAKQMQVTVKMEVDGKGKVTGASVKFSNATKTIDACVIQAVRRIAFPATPDGLPVAISYPFSFVP